MCCWQYHGWCYLTEFWSVCAARKCHGPNQVMYQTCVLYTNHIREQGIALSLTHTHTDQSLQHRWYQSLHWHSYSVTCSPTVKLCAADHRFCWPATQWNVTISQGSRFSTETLSQPATPVNPSIMIRAVSAVLSCLNYCISFSFSFYFT